MRRLIAAALLLALIAGCSSRPVPGPGPATEPQPPVTEPAPTPTPAPAPPPEVLTISRKGDGIEVPGTLDGQWQWYLFWSPDRSRIAFQTGTGVWAISPDGKVQEHLLSGTGRRQVAGWWEGAVVMVEFGEHDSRLLALRAGRDPEALATLPGVTKVTSATLLLVGDRLVISPDGKPLQLFDLRTRTLSPLGDADLGNHPIMVASPDDGAVLFKQSRSNDAVWIMNLPTGQLHRVEGETYGENFAWAPDGAHWAVEAAEPGTELPPSGELEASHVDVVDVTGQVRHLRPPEPLRLFRGLGWSADGSKLAVQAKVQDATQGIGWDWVSDFWVVDVATNSWTRLFRDTGPYGGAQWHPDGKHVVTSTAWHLSMTTILIPLDGGAPEKFPFHPQAEVSVPPDERLLTVAGGRGPLEQPMGFRAGEGGQRVPVAAGIGVGMSYQIRSGYASWVSNDYHLIVVPVPKPNPYAP